jgi:hypothetical protein
MEFLQKNDISIKKTNNNRENASSIDKHTKEIQKDDASSIGNVPAYLNKWPIKMRIFYKKNERRSCKKNNNINRKKRSF